MQRNAAEMPSLLRNEPAKFIIYQRYKAVSRGILDFLRRCVVMAATNPKKFISKVTFSSKTSDVTHGKELSSHERYFVLEIPQEINFNALA